jgi:hypothetical protein
MVGPSPCSSNRPISLVDSLPRPMINPEGIELVTGLFSDEHPGLSTFYSIAWRSLFSVSLAYSKLEMTSALNETHHDEVNA